MRTVPGSTAQSRSRPATDLAGTSNAAAAAASAITEPILNARP
jgi:hypothetical protein